jgi:hypothetical protein
MGHLADCYAIARIGMLNGIHTKIQMDIVLRVLNRSHFIQSIDCHRPSFNVKIRPIHEQKCITEISSHRGNVQGNRFIAAFLVN